MTKRPRKNAQLSFEKVGGWGGKRRGAGRPNRSGRVHHMKRPAIDRRYPLHVTWRLRKDLPDLRDDRYLNAFREAATNAKGLGLRILHFSLESNHIHMMIEADSGAKFADGMRSLGCSLGKRVRRLTNETKSRPTTGSVFAGRYHVRVFKTPTETRNALEYVLLNHAKHRQFVEHVDVYSSGFYFRDWKKLLGKRYSNILKEQVEGSDRLRLHPTLSEPKSWLAQTGWTKAVG
ncbi:MAG: transposase [Bdellovibrionia bacterium]